MAHEIGLGPKSFGTFEKQVPSVTEMSRVDRKLWFLWWIVQKDKSENNQSEKVKVVY